VTETETEVTQNNDLIQGTCFIKDKILNILYVLGATILFFAMCSTP